MGMKGDELPRVPAGRTVAMSSSRLRRLRANPKANPARAYGLMRSQAPTARRCPPGKGAGVELHELSHRRRPGPAPVLRRAARALGRSAERPPNAAHGCPAHRQGVDLLQLLGEVDVVEARVSRRHERDDLRAEGGGQPPRRGLAAAAMHQAAQAPTSKAGLEAL